MRRKTLMMVSVIVMLAVLSGCVPASPAPEQKPEVKEEVAEKIEETEPEEEEAIVETVKPEEEASEPEEEEAETEPEEKEEAEEEAGEAAPEKDPDAPCYTIDVNWTYFESDEPRYDLCIDLESGTSEIDPASVRVVQESYEVGYCKVNGTEVPVFTREVLEDGFFVEILRDDIKYSITFQTFSNLVDTDCKAVITGSDGSVETIKREDALYRSYTGAWYFGIGTITNGQFGEYEISAAQLEHPITN